MAIDPNLKPVLLGKAFSDMDGAVASFQAETVVYPHDGRAKELLRKAMANRDQALQDKEAQVATLALHRRDLYPVMQLHSTT